MKRHLLILCVALLSKPLLGQNLHVDSLNYHMYFIIKPTQNELVQYCQGKWKPDPSVLNRAIGRTSSYDSIGLIASKPGCYIITDMYRNAIDFRLYQNNSFRITLHNLEDGIRIQVWDQQNKPLRNARLYQVKKNKPIHFVKKPDGYVNKNKELKGFIVNVNGELGVYSGSYNSKKSDLRAIRKPSKGTIRKYELFSALSQAKYKPGDTVKFTSYIVKRGKPYNGKVLVKATAQYGRKVYFKDVIKPNKNGNYQYHFPLTDSIKIDQSFHFQFKPKRSKRYRRLSFRIADYELDKTKLELEIQQYRKSSSYLDSAKIIINATDVNGFAKFGSRIKLWITSDVDGIAGSYKLIPDTLWFHQLVVNEFGPAHCFIPDSVLRAYKGKIRVKCELTSPTYEVLTKFSRLSITDELTSFSVNSSDSLRIGYFVKGIETSTKGKLFKEYVNEMVHEEVEFPYVGPIDPYVKRYQVESNGKKEYLAYMGNKVFLKRKQSRDSIFFYLKNPRRLPIEYIIYKNGKRYQVGKIGQLEKIFGLKREGENLFHLEVSFIWFGKSQHLTTSNELEDKTIELLVDHPKHIFPGQEVPIKVIARNTKGEPLKDVAVASFAVNDQLSSRSSYTMDDNNTYVPNLYLDYQYLSEFKRSKRAYVKSNAWLEQAGLSEDPLFKQYNPFAEVQINYYNYDHEEFHSASDTSSGQLSFIVFGKRDHIAVNQIYVNGFLKYDLAIQANKRSIILKSGQYNVRIRTAKYTYYFDSVLIKPGMKTVYSLVENEVRGQKRKRSSSKMSKQELKWAKQSAIHVVNDSRHEVMVQSPSNESTLIKKTKSSRYSYRVEQTLGPYFYGDIIEFHLDNGLRFKFSHKPNRSYWVTENKVLVLPHNFRSLKRERASKSTHRTYIGPLAYGYNSIQFYDSTEKEYSIYSMPNPKSEFNRVRFFSKGLDYFYRKERFNIIKNLDTKKSSFTKGNLSSEYLASGLYQVVVIESVWGLVSEPFKVDAGGTTYVNLRFMDTLDYETLKSKELVPFEYENVLRNRLKDQNGILFHLEDWEGNMLDFRRVTLLGDDTLFKRTDQRGNLLITAKPGEVIRLRYNRTCYDQDSSIYTYRYTRDSGIQNIGVRLNCVSPALDLTSQNDVGYLEYSSYYGGGSYLSNVSFWFPSTPVSRKYRRFQPLRCPDFGSKYDSDDFHSFRENNNDGVSFLGTRSDAVHYYTNASSVSKLSSRYENTTRLFKPGGFYKRKGKYLSFDYNEGDGVKDKFDRDILKDSFMGNLASSGMRSNFSDLGYWKPFIQTDPNGVARFIVKYPDDIATWRNHTLAMDVKYNTGQRIQYTRSYKPYLAQLHTPRFLIQGDSAYIQTELLNLSGNEETVEEQLSINGTLRLNQKVDLKNSLYQSHLIVADLSRDSALLNYRMTSSQGYVDGEERFLKQYPKGLEKTMGQFVHVATDTTIQFENPERNLMRVEVSQNDKNYLIQSLKKVVDYEFNCNEQMASKLRALLVLQKMKEGFGLKQVALINRYINRLERNQNVDGSWGWWSTGSSNIWMTCYVVNALGKAKIAGHKTKSLEKTISYLRNQIDLKTPPNQLILILNTLLDLNITPAVKDVLLLVKSGDPIDYALIQFKLNKHLKDSTSTADLLRYQRKDIFGHTFWGKNNHTFGSRHISQTCEMYRMLKEEGEKSLLPSISAYLLSQHRPSDILISGANTYESTWILETLAEDLMENKTGPNRVYIDTGTGFETISLSSPFFTRARHYRVKYEGKSPTYISSSYRKFVSEPKKNDSIYAINVYFEKNSESTAHLEEGKKVQMVVEVDAKYESRYVMLSIPIPAGCSYLNEVNHQAGAEYREQFANKTHIYRVFLPAGKTKIELSLLPRYSGIYNLNPIKVELMYFPVINGNNQLSKLSIQKPN